MMKMTSAYASKVLRKLSEDKDYWRNKEKEGCLYIASVDEEPVVPNYDYERVAAEIEAIDKKMLIIKHAINHNNAINEIAVGDHMMTIDSILIKMAQLSRRKTFLDELRKNEPKSRYNSGAYSRKAAPEYIYINYDLDVIKADYAKVDEEIAAMQIALDKYNQTFEFEVQI